MARRKKEQESGSDTFVVMYVALMILLLAFFIVMNTMATPDETRRRAALGSLIGTFGTPQGKQLMKLFSTTSDAEKIQKTVERQIEQQAAKSIPKILKEIKKHANSDYIDFSVSGKNIEITINSGVMFRPGDDEILPKIFPVLNAVAEKILMSECPVVIEGHTDSTPIQSVRFPSNWELSAFRALAVQNYMVDRQGMSPAKIVTFGYADQHPIALNNTAESKEKNRRVQVVLLGVGDMAKSTGMKTWWRKMGSLNPFDRLQKEY